MVRLERRDVSTEEHTRRVALLAARVGEELKLSATARRHLAVGGLLHDIGKLSVPLRDPQQARQADRRRSSPRSSATRATAASCSRSSAASREAVRGLVSDHHERLDGRGYPRGLTADADEHRDAHPRRLRRLRRAGLRPRVPRRLDARARVRACSRRRRTRTTRPSSPRSSASSAARAAFVADVSRSAPRRRACGRPRTR